MSNVFQASEFTLSGNLTESNKKHHTQFLNLLSKTRNESGIVPSIRVSFGDSDYSNWTSYLKYVLLFNTAHYLTYGKVILPIVYTDERTLKVMIQNFTQPVLRRTSDFARLESLKQHLSEREVTMKQYGMSASFTLNHLVTPEGNNNFDNVLKHLANMMNTTLSHIIYDALITEGVRKLRNKNPRDEHEYYRTVYLPDKMRFGKVNQMPDGLILVINEGIRNMLNNDETSKPDFIIGPAFKIEQNLISSTVYGTHYGTGPDGAKRGWGVNLDQSIAGLKFLESPRVPLNEPLNNFKTAIRERIIGTYCVMGIHPGINEHDYSIWVYDINRGNYVQITPEEVLKASGLFDYDEVEQTFTRKADANPIPMDIRNLTAKQIFEKGCIALLVAPHQKYTMEGVIIVKGGSDTGYCFQSPEVFDISSSALQLQKDIGLKLSAAALVKNPNYVNYIPDVFYDSYSTAGNGSKLITYEVFMNHKPSTKRQRFNAKQLGDYYVCLFFKDDDYTPTVSDFMRRDFCLNAVSEEYKFPIHHEFYNRYWEWNSLDNIPFPGDEARMHTASWISMGSFGYMKEGGSALYIEQGDSHHGPYENVSCRSVRSSGMGIIRNS